MRWTTEAGLPAEDSSLAHVLNVGYKIELLTEPVQFHPMDYYKTLEVEDIFYRYENPESKYPDNSLWRVVLHNNGAYLLLRVNGSGHIFATRDWFYSEAKSKSFGYTKVGRYTGKPARLATDMEAWVREFTAV